MILVSAYTSADAQQRRDGNWWRSLPENSRLMWVAGAVDGVLEFAPLLLQDGAKDALSLAMALQSGGIIADGLPDATVGQMKDGLDVLYQDFRNRQIALPNGIFVVVKQIGGTPQPEIDRLLERFRAGK